MVLEVENTEGTEIINSISQNNSWSGKIIFPDQFNIYEE